MVSGCSTAEKFANGSRKILGCQPNLTGYHMILKKKLKQHRHVLASKSMKMKSYIGEDNMMLLDIMMSAVQYTSAT